MGWSGGTATRDGEQYQSQGVPAAESLTLLCLLPAPGSVRTQQRRCVGVWCESPSQSAPGGRGQVSHAGSSKDPGPMPPNLQHVKARIQALSLQRAQADLLASLSKQGDQERKTKLMLEGREDILMILLFFRLLSHHAKYCACFFKQIQRFYLENRGERKGEREATQIFKMEQLAYFEENPSSLENTQRLSLSLGILIFCFQLPHLRLTKGTTSCSVRKLATRVRALEREF